MGPAGKGRGQHNAEKTHCPEGHPYDEANTYHPPTGGRYCRTCMKRRNREWRARNRQAANRLREETDGTP